jgi:hypothetical protein
MLDRLPNFEHALPRLCVHQGSLYLTHVRRIDGTDFYTRTREVAMDPTAQKYVGGVYG